MYHTKIVFAAGAAVPPVHVHEFHEAVAILLNVPEIRVPRSYLSAGVVPAELLRIVDNCVRRSAKIPDYSPWEREFIAKYVEPRAAGYAWCSTHDYAPALRLDRIIDDYGITNIVSIVERLVGLRAVPRVTRMQFLGGDRVFVYFDRTSFVLGNGWHARHNDHIAGNFIGDKVYQDYNCRHCFIGNGCEVAPRSVQFGSRGEATYTDETSFQRQYDVILPCGLRIRSNTYSNTVDAVGVTRTLYDPATGRKVCYRTGRVADPACTVHCALGPLEILGATEHAHLEQTNYNDFGDSRRDHMYFCNPQHIRIVH